MKRTLFLILFFLPMLASADAVEIDGIYYNLETKTNQAEVTLNPNQYKGDVVIPESVTYKGAVYSVTSIGDIAFAGCSGLISITIPDGVTSIGESAFDSCKGLTSITIPDGVTSIGVSAFYGCSGLTSITIGNSVTSIGELAFSFCSSLTSIKVESKNTKYDSRDNCNGIIETKSNTLIIGCQNTIIPSSVISIGNKAFYDCSGLTSVTIPNGVTFIGDYAFWDCSDLTSVTIPNSVTFIGDYAFAHCSNLTSIAIGNGVTSIGKSAFIGCSGLMSIDIPEGVTSIGDCAFLGCSSLTSITIPGGVISICREAFSGCSGLTSITIPSSVKSIGFGAFVGCSGLTSITIPNSVIEIGSYVFSQCSGLTSVTIPNSVVSISDGAFWDCSGLLDFYCYAENVPTTESDAFYNVNIAKITLHVPAASVSAYQAVEPWKNFKETVALSDQGNDTDDSEYLPFVESGKIWHVVNSTTGYPNYHFNQYTLMNEEVVKDGKTYLKMYRTEDDKHVVYDTGLYREEDRRVYKYDEKAGRDVMLYDFSLKEGDTFTYEFGYSQPKNFKVLKQGWLEDGPKIVTSRTLTPTGTKEYNYRQLRTWTIGREREDTHGEYYEVTTWVEGVGTLENLLARLEIDGKMDCMAYIERDENKCDYSENTYLPFSFYDYWGPVYGCNLPKGAADYSESDGHHQLTYEQEGDRLHVHGKVFTQCGPNSYAYFIAEPIDNSPVFKLRFEIQEVEPLADCMGLFYTDFYISGLEPLFDYKVVVDNQGEEHPVIKKTQQDMPYRPFVEDGKVWTYHYHGFNGREFNVDRIIDGDTIIGGLTYKKIYDKIGGQYQYALREEGKKIYIVYPHYETASLLYDFSKNVGDVINELTHPLIVASVDTIDIDGVKFRRMRVQDADQPVEEWNDDLIHMYNFWIEGVGSESLLESSIREEGNAYNLLSCQINGRVYTQHELLGIVGKPTPQNDYRPFVEEGKVWKVGNTQTILDNSVQVVDYYYFAGDTIINGKTCKQMMCQRFVSPDFSDEYGYWTPKSPLSKVGAWYEEDKKVYFCYEGTLGMYMLYDFSLEANDTLILRDYQPYYTVGPKQTGGLNGFKGVYKDIMICGRDYYITTWLEGVGGIDGPLRNVYPETAGDPQFLMACTVGDEVIYLNDEYEDGATPAEARKKRFDFTHTIKIQPKARKRSEELSLYGEYNDLQLGINLDPLDNDYLVRITDESGKVVYEKAVNAGSIVGLNIDISAYVKSRYTVTVENSQESFTGQFETQATGIEAIRNNKEEKGIHIYNLQGQRLSSLQKGLNIVNGRKIYVR